MEMWDYAAEGTLDGYDVETQIDRPEYWRRSLADSGITALDPLPNAYDLVTLQDLKCEDVLRPFVKKNWGKLTTESDLEFDTSLISGGYILRLSGLDLIYPSQGMALYDLENWKSASNYTGEKLQELWIGHPYLYVRNEGEWLTILEADSTEIVSVARSAFQNAVRKAENELGSFKLKMQSILEEWLPEKMAKAVVLIVLYWDWSMQHWFE
jgi:hypothetical protein